MQEFSDSVAELDSKDATPLALQRSMQALKVLELENERAIVGQTSRRRFIDQKINSGPNGDDELCLICSDTEGGQQVITHCVHLFHWNCLALWFDTRFNRTCPVCRSSLNHSKAFTKLADKKIIKPLAIKQKPSDSDPDTSMPDQAGPSSVKVEDIVEAEGLAETDDLDEDKLETKFNYLPQGELELINDVALKGAALGSKLDFITKHVLHLRDKHQRAMNDFYADDGRANASEKAPTEAKILIYSGWQYACEVLAQALERERIGYVRLETPGKGRKENAVIDFKENPDVAVFILHAQSQAAGLVSLACFEIHLS